MRTLSLLLPASLLVLASSAGAQNLPYPPSTTTAISTVQVTGVGHTIRIRSDQARKIGGTYEMSNGWNLEVRTMPRYIDAAIDKQAPLRLFPVAPYRFASQDGNVTMAFNRGVDGDEMMMSYVPGPGLAQVVLSSESVAQR